MENTKRGRFNRCVAQMFSCCRACMAGPTRAPTISCVGFSLVGALKDAGASRVTALVPYLCYGRKDRRTKPNDPVTTRYVASLFEAVGTDCVVTMDVHNPSAFENGFRCPTVALTAAPLFVDYVSRFPTSRLRRFS